MTDKVRNVNERSARYYGDWMARHEREHIAQVARILEHS